MAFRSMIAATLVLSTQAGAQTPLPMDSLTFAADRWVEQGLLRYQIAGAALVIVRDGRIIHRRGFGMADIERGYRVDPDTTVFHVASITKLVTAIAALQQVAAGRLQLRGDVRPMLGPIAAAGWERNAVTLEQLLTHTAGLDTRWIGMAAHHPADVRPLAEYLPGAMPPIIDPPGSVTRYSNHGYAAIGRLVEVASGIPWAGYVEQRVFAPLGMTRSYARPRARDASHAIPYRYRRDTLPEPDLFEHTAPAGAVHSTATDLARLMIALLDSTATSPLAPDYSRRPITPKSHLGGVRGYAYGTFEYPNPYVPAVIAGGDVPGYSARMLMVPSQRFGVVVLVNRKDPTLAEQVMDSVLARVSSAPAADLAMQCASTLRPTTSTPKIAGHYRANIYDRSSFLRVAALLGPMVSVRDDTGGSLVIVNPANNTAFRWRRVADSTWSSPRGECLSVISRGGAPMLVLSTKSGGPITLERVTRLSSPSVVLSAVVTSILALLIALGAEVWSLRRRGAPAFVVAKQMRRLTLAIPTLHLLFLLFFVVGLNQLAIAYDDRFAFGLPRWFSATLMIPHVAIALTILLAAVMIRSRALRDVSRWRAWLTVLASAQLSLVLVVWRAVWTP